MSRHFPRTARARVAAALLSGSVLLAGAAAPAAHAVGSKRPRDPAAAVEARKHRVEQQITGAHQNLDESSNQLRSATSALLAARWQLGAAQAHLADTRGRLSAATVLDLRMQARLDGARMRLTEAQHELAAGRRKIAVEQGDLRAIVVSNYQTGDPSLMGLSMVMTTQDPTQLTGQLNSVQNVVDKEGVVLDRLEVSRALLGVQERQVAAAKAVVATQRRAAAANLVRKQGLESQAQAQEASVSGLVDARTVARQEADRARRADVAQLTSLGVARARLSARLKRLADEARARAAMAAAQAADSGVVLGDSGPVHSNGFLNYPVVGPITSPFGWRIHPIYGYRSLHDGVDFGVACGTPVRAAAAGTVLERHYQTAWGNRIVINHGFHHGVGLATIANHLEAPALAAPGEHVRRGQIVGYVGTTGWSTGCHLHFTVMENGTAVNPLAWF